MRLFSTSLLVLLTLFLLLDLSGATLSQSDKKKPTKKKTGDGAKKKAKKSETPPPSSGPSSQSVFDKGLVRDEVTAADILRHAGAFSQEVDRRAFSRGDVLGYVTPWNSRGYDVAKDFGRKFGLISPVWLQLLPKEGSRFGVNGLHDVDQGWMREVRSKGAKILPRVLFDRWTGQDYMQLFQVSTI